MTALLVVTYDAVAPEDRRRTAGRRPTTTSPTLTTRVRDTLERIAAPQPAERYEAIFTNDRNSFPAR
jgi:hypothetical protein